MTVAAVILAASPSSALADAAGRASVRRIAETAWAGGAMPLVVVAPDPDGAVGRALGGSEAVLAAPAPLPAGVVAQVTRGMRAAAELVASTDAALVWPTELTWVDPESVTMLLQAHGLEPESLLRPGWRGAGGWPVLVPVRHLDALGALPDTAMPDGIVRSLEATGVPVRILDLGDPGAVIDRDTPIDALPPYEGPVQPVGMPPEWGAAVSDIREDAPAAGIRRIDPGPGA